MLTSLKLLNFQAHRDLEIQLDQQVTTIIGPSDVGKSAVIRALRWVCLNVPVSSMVREGAKGAGVVVEVGDGSMVVRYRAGSENLYTLNGQEYRAFRSDVPASIAKLLNIDPLSFQSQHDPIYWFSSSAGEVSRQLNAVVNLDLIDRTLQAITSVHNKARVVAQAAEERLSKAIEEKDTLRWVEEADQDYRGVEECGDVARKMGAGAARLQAVVAQVVETLAVMVLSQDMSKEAGHLLMLAGAAGKLASRISAIEQVEVRVTEASAEKFQPIPDLSPVERTRELMVEARKNRIPLETALVDARSRYEDKVKTARRLEEAVGDLESETEGRCPVCGGVLDLCPAP